MLTRLMILLFLSTPVRAETPLVVFAAASLGGPLDEVAEAFTGEVTISYAGSASLARQVEAGAPADVVILANQAWMDHLVTRGVVAEDAVQVILGNRLVLAGSVGASPALTGLDDWPEGARIATGFTEAVPVGIYARQTLEAMELWGVIAPRLVQTENARLALALLARGEVAGAFVYASDALAETRVQVIEEIDPALHDPILYPAAPVSDHPGANGFIAFLEGAEAQAIFAAGGFTGAP